MGDNPNQINGATPRVVPIHFHSANLPAASEPLANGGLVSSTYQHQAGLSGLVTGQQVSQVKKEEPFCVKKDSWYKPRELACNFAFGVGGIIYGAGYLIKEGVKDIGPALSFDNLKLVRSD